MISLFCLFVCCLASLAISALTISYLSKYVLICTLSTIILLFTLSTFPVVHSSPPLFLLCNVCLFCLATRWASFCPQGFSQVPPPARSTHHHSISSLLNCVPTSFPCIFHATHWTLSTCSSHIYGFTRISYLLHWGYK